MDDEVGWGEADQRVSGKSQKRKGLPEEVVEERDSIENR